MWNPWTTHWAWALVKGIGEPQVGVLGQSTSFKMAARPVVRILAFGDSLTEGWCDFGTKFHPYTRNLQTLIQSLSKSVDVVNMGVSGETTAQMSERLPLVLNKHGPFDLVIILGGTNDLGLSLNKDGEPLFRRLSSLHELARRYSPLSVAVTIPETGYEAMDRFTALREKRLQVNALLKEYVQDCGSKIILSDLAAKLPRESLSREDCTKFWADDLHLTPAGYDRMGEIIFEDIKHCVIESEELWSWLFDQSTRFQELPWAVKSMLRMAGV